MRNKVLVPAMPNLRGNSPANRKALTVKMNNFVGDDGLIPRADPSTGTWPLREEKRKQPRKPRPLTATLERPRLLDISLLGKIDMSLMRKELLSIYTLMRAPITIRQKSKQNKRNKPVEDDTENDENFSPTLLKPKCKNKGSSKRNSFQSIMIDTITHSLKKEHRQRSSTRSLPVREKSPLKLGPTITRHSRNNIKKKVDEILNGPVIKPLALPCDSCGRASHPERLHTHPPPPSPVTPISTRNITLKPNGHIHIPPRSRSDELLHVLREKEKGEDRRGSIRRRKSPQRRSAIMNSVPPARSSRVSNPESDQPIAGVPILCSYCGRRFGTASIAIHEGKCRERKDGANVSGESRPRVPRASTSPARRQSSPKKITFKKPRAETAEGIITHSNPPQITLTVPPTTSPRTDDSSRVAPTSLTPRTKHLTVNDRRPKRQEIPEEEDYIFKSNGSLDCEATFHQIWANHLKSLIECPRCLRRFAPDRIEKHQAVCTGANKRPTQPK